MEPMNLGSAPSSPSSPTLNPAFLPAFLMGENPQTSTPTSSSPARAGSRIGSTTSPDARILYPSLFSQNLDSPKQTFTPHKSGPPKQGLFDVLEKKLKPPAPISSLDSSVAFGRSHNIEENSRFYESVNLSRVEKINTHWVTVFGFPSSALSLVLAQLSNCGLIVDKVIPPEGNWIHVKFNDLYDIPRALTLNGKCISNCIMIGVSLYYNKEDKENETVYSSPIRARSLRHSYITASANNSVVPLPNVPQKSTGLVSKAIEYVFGW